jgi:hypothetical protein
MKDMDAIEQLSPDEDVTLGGRKLTLRTAVETYIRENVRNSIFRTGDPSILDDAQIRILGARWGILE